MQHERANEMKTVVIIGATSAGWVVETAARLRERDVRVLIFGRVSVVGYLLITERIDAVLIDDGFKPSNWQLARDGILRIAPHTAIVIVGADGPEPGDLVAKIVAA
jgi:hypothetical protein